MLTSLFGPELELQLMFGKLRSPSIQIGYYVSAREIKQEIKRLQTEISEELTRGKYISINLTPSLELKAQTSTAIISRQSKQERKRTRLKYNELMLNRMRNNISS